MSQQTEAPERESLPQAVASLPARTPAGPLTVFRKEFAEVFRDKRTVYTVIISPLLITPAILGVVGGMVRGQISAAEKTTYSVGAVGAAAAPSVRAMLQTAPHLRTEELSLEVATADVRSHRLKAAAVVPPDAEERLRLQKAIPITVLFDAGDQTSHEAAQRLADVFSLGGQAIVGRRLALRSLPKDLATPFRVDEQPIKSGGTAATFMLSMFLPYILAISAVAGGLYCANDLVAGEKERGTLETLLVSPVPRRRLVMGKFLTVASVCLVSSLLSVVGMMIPFYLPLKAYEWLAKGGLSLHPTAVAAILLVQLPLAVLFAGLLLAISTFARNQKEAQTYLGPLMLLVMVPAMMSMFVKADAPIAMALVPVLNATLVLKQALSGAFEPAFLLVAFAASAAYAAAAVLFATSLFERESVLLKA